MTDCRPRKEDEFCPHSRLTPVRGRLASDDDRRPVRDKRRTRARGQTLDETVAIQFRYIRVESGFPGSPNLPPGVLDLILIALGPAGCITPIMLGDEFFLRTYFDRPGCSLGCGVDRLPLLRAPPCVLHANAGIGALNGVTHRKGRVGLAVKRPGDESDGAPGNQLPHKNHTSSPAAPGSAPDVKSKVHFLEIGMHRD